MPKFLLFVCSTIFCYFYVFFVLTFLDDSEKTEIESTHSSNVSGYPPSERQQQHQYNGHHQSVIPPDALYTTNEKMVMTQNPSPHPYNNQQFAYEADFNDSKVNPDNYASSNLMSKIAFHYSIHSF